MGAASPSSHRWGEGPRGQDLQEAPAAAGEALGWGWGQ